MQDSDTTIRAPHSKTDERTSVSMKIQGCELVLFFDDLSGEGPLRELRLLPDAEELEPRALRQLAPRSPLYLAYARAAIQWRRDDVRAAVRAIRGVATTRRGLDDDFYRLIGHNYNVVVGEGEPHPVKALAEMHHVVISTASRWIKEARRRDYITG